MFLVTKKLSGEKLLLMILQQRGKHDKVDLHQQKWTTKCSMTFKQCSTDSLESQQTVRQPYDKSGWMLDAYENQIRREKGN